MDDQSQKIIKVGDTFATLICCAQRKNTHDRQTVKVCLCLRKKITIALSLSPLRAQITSPSTIIRIPLILKLGYIHRLRAKIQDNKLNIILNLSHVIEIVGIEDFGHRSNQDPRSTNPFIKFLPFFFFFASALIST